MTLSKKAVRPAQTAFLLANGMLPISLNYRLCPEINVIDGPMTDVRDAYAWAQSPSQTSLQAMLDDKGIPVKVDRGNIVVVGWSTGGHLAMSTAWTTKGAGLRPPRAILSFYAPTDFESGGESRFPYKILEPRAELWFLQTLISDGRKCIQNDGNRSTRSPNLFPVVPYVPFSFLPIY